MKILTNFMIWFSVSLFSLVQFFLQVSGNAISYDIQKYFNISTGEAGILFSAFFWAYLIIQVPAGIILDNIGSKKALLPAVIILGFGCVMFATTNSFHIAIISRIVMGIGAGFGFIGMVFVISERFSPKHFPILLGLGELLGMVGSGIGQYFASSLVLNFKWQSLIWLSALMCLTTAILIMLYIPSYKVITKSRKNIISEIIDIFYKVSKVKIIWLCGLFGMGTFAVLTAFADVWGADYLINAQGLTYIQASKLISFIFIGIAIGSPILGKIGRNINRKINTMIISALIMLVLSISILYVNIGSNTIYTIIMLGLGITSSVYLFSFSILNDFISKEIMGAAMGFCNTIILTGAIIFQPLTGFMLNSLKYHPSCYQLSMVCFPIAVLISLLIALYFILPNKHKARV